MSEDVTEPSVLSPKDEGLTNVKKLAKNKRRKLGHQKPQDVTGVHIPLPLETHMSVEGVSNSTPKCAEKQLEQHAPSGSDDSTWNVSEPLGGRYIDADPVLTDYDNERYLILAQDNAIKVFSVETSLMVRKLTVPEPATISAFAVSTTNSSQLYAITSAGTIYHWGFVTGNTIEVSTIGPGVVCLSVFPFEFNGKQWDVLVALHTVGGSSNLKAYRTPKSSRRGTLEEKTILKSPFKAKFFKAGRDGRVIALVANDQLSIGLTEQLDFDSLQSLTYVWRQVPVSEPIRSLAIRVRGLSSKKELSIKNQSSFSPARFSLDLAIGCDTGAVMVFDNLLNNLLLQETPKNESTPASFTPRRLHWHREPVNAVQWSIDGNYIISGGSETVLVLWQLDTGKRQFLPHLSASIEKFIISRSGTSYAIKLGDNSVVVLSTTDLKPVASISSIQARTIDSSAIHLPKDPKSRPESAMLLSIAPCAVRPSNPSQLLLAVPASRRAPRGCYFPTATFLQTYDLDSDQHVSRQALTRTNTTNFNLGPEGTPIIEPDVRHIVVSSDGHWLVSVDDWVQPEQDIKALGIDPAEPSKSNMSLTECFLKVWSWNIDSMEWSLVTRIDVPRSSRDKTSDRVMDIISHPSDTSFASLGEDGNVRFWGPKPRRRDGVLVKNKSGEALMSWACVQTIRLASGAISPTQAPSLAFSADGSVLAVALKGSVYFIDSFSGEITFVRNGIYADGPVRIGFLERYLIVLSNDLRIYDTVNDKMDFVISTKPAGKAVDHFLSRSLTRLSIHSSTGTFAIAVPGFSQKEASATARVNRTLQSEIAIFKPTSPIALFTMTTHQTVTSLTAVPAGFALLDAALNVRTISARGAMAVSLPKNIEKSTRNQFWIRNTYGSQKSETTGDGQGMPGELPTPMEAERFESEEPGQDGEQENSRSTRIRRGQLADLFDVGPSYAMPAVSQLFEEVAGLVLKK